MSDLFLRKVDHRQASDNYRVILKDDVTEIEIGSIGIVAYTGTDRFWTWGIDTVIPLREIESSGQGKDRRECMRLFKAAWLAHCERPGWREEFLEARRRPSRHRVRVP